ncbi:MAG: hypothetical protein GF307_00200 [candidate division Zixibacteria bacterium]|nr:hypothetical protein [candidate division Zixibacteria bacterium]
MALESAGIWNDLPPKEQAILMDLKATDAKVKAHEQAHLSAAGGYATGGANFTYTVGPDGKPYATGGKVQIDTSPIHGDPEATIKKAKTIQKAALAPMDPSTQDRAVAAKAAAMERLARTEMVGPEKKSINVISNSTIGNVELLNSEIETPKNYGPNQNSSYSAGKQIDLTA